VVRASICVGNPNVYYELGIAHAVGTEAVPLIQKDEQIPFDHRANRIVIYEDTADGHGELAANLTRRIKSLAFDSNPQILIKNERVDKFNEWRRRGVAGRFGGEEFDELNLRCIDLSRCSLSETSFRHSVLDQSNLRDATAIRADFTGASLRAVDARGANVSEAKFEAAQMQDADLRGDIALRVELLGADMTGADVAGLRVDEATFQRYPQTWATAKNPHTLIRER
jgi:uncharacterized protein YjbI with pentapeptide repeats